MPIRTLSSDIQYYPDVIENEVQLPRVYDGVTKISANTINRLRDAILRIEEELGVSPSGSYSTVSERLDALESSTGSDLTELEGQINALEGQVNLLAADLGDFKGGFDTLEDRLSHVDDLIGEPILELVAGENLEEGNLVRITNNGKIRKASCNSPNPDFARVIGSIYNDSVLEDGLARVYSNIGTLIKVKFSVAPEQEDNGRPVYLSTNNGEGSLEVPTVIGSVIFMVGILQGANGVELTPKVVFQPSFITLLE